MKRERIWELDALRGFCILCVIVVHTLFDLIFFYGAEISLPDWYVFVQQYGGVIFVILSGLCATLGSRSVTRGLVVFGFGMAISVVTAGMYFLGFAGRDVIVWFGVLHLLGICMMLYPLYRRLSTPVLCALAVVFVVTGYLFGHVTVTCPALFPLGLTTAQFTSSDYFPLLPHLGWYMLGTVLGRRFYRDQKTLLPGSFSRSVAARFLCWCGRQSLWIYVAHQPIVYGVLELIWLLRSK